MFNPCDPVLHFYHVVERFRRVRSMGSDGVGALADEHGVLRQLNVSGTVGRTHNLQNYLCSRRLMASVRQYVTSTSSLAARGGQPSR
jgi:hypothetical protein